MMMKIIRITVKKGNVEVDYQGYTGNECFEAEEKLRQILSKNLNVNFTVKELKPEYYQEQQEQRRLENENY